MRTSIQGSKMKKAIVRTLLLATTLCSASIAQTPAPSTPDVDLRIFKSPASTLYLHGERPIARITPNGLTTYAYKDGRPAIAMRTDGRYAEFKYENGKLERIDYSDGTVRRAGEKLLPSAGSRLAARGGVAPMNWASEGDDGWAGWDDDYYIQYDGADRHNGGDEGGDGGEDPDFPEEGRPHTPLQRLQCLYAASMTLQISLLQVCPIMRDQSICMGRAVDFNRRTVVWCMGG